MMPLDDRGPVPEMVCRHCREPLNRYRPFDSVEETWKHGLTGERDHEAEPIPKAEAVHVSYVCDFCCGDARVEWIYRTHGEIVSHIVTPTYTGREDRRRVGRHWEAVSDEQGVAEDLAAARFSDGWTACGPCARFIEIPDVERLITHLRRLNPAVFGRVTRSMLRDHFREFFTRKTGREPVPDPPTEELS